MKKELKFKIINRTSDDCEHDTGVIHSSGTSCEEAEMIIKIFAMNENDPDHESVWHNQENSPNLIILDV
jgi:hypothetical protein